MHGKGSGLKNILYFISYAVSSTVHKLYGALKRSSLQKRVSNFAHCSRLSLEDFNLDSSMIISNYRQAAKTF